MRWFSSGLQQPLNTLRCRGRGFTLLELMVVMAIVAILATLAAPSLRSMMQSSARASAVNTFIADMAFARSEAIRRGGGVVMCRSDAPEAASPACSTTPPNTSSGWASGWIVFHDLNDPSKPNLLLRVQAPVVSIDGILEAGSGASSVFRFTASGRLFELASATSLTFGGASFEPASRRVLCIGFSGRAHIAAVGATDCGAST